eukprot:655000-Prymnesium_polylepis.1
MHRDDVHHPQPQSHAQASRFFDEANVVTLRKLDTSDTAEGERRRPAARASPRTLSSTAGSC